MQLPCMHGDTAAKPENRDETCWNLRTSISRETLQNLTLCSYRINVSPRVFLMNLKISDFKIAVSTRRSSTCQNMTPASHRICMLSQLDAILTMPFTENTYRDTCLQSKMEVSKCCTCHEKWESFSENDAKISCMSHRMILDPS